MRKAGQSIARELDRFDAFVTPTLTQPPRPIGYWSMEDGDRVRYLARGSDAALVFAFNISGLPTISIPAGLTSENAPSASRSSAATATKRPSCSSRDRSNRQRHGPRAVQRSARPREAPMFSSASRGSEDALRSHRLRWLVAMQQFGQAQVSLWGFEICPLTSGSEHFASHPHSKREHEMTRTMMRAFTAFLATVAAFGVAAANADTVALVTINQQALFFNQINDGAKQAADKAGAKLVIFNANNQAAAQNSAIEDYIAQKVDGIVLVAIDVNGVKPAITAAKKVGIPVVAIDARIPDGDNAAFIGVDNKGAGEQIGKYFADYAKSKMSGSAKVGIVGALNSFIQNQRLDGFKAAAQAGGNVKFLDTVDGQNIQDVALTAAENLMTANPDMNALYATGEPALIGAISAVTSQKRTDKVKVFGWDLTAQAIKGIDEGWIVAVVQQDPFQEGVAGVETILKIKKGEKVNPSIDIPITIVTKENVDKYRSLFK
jgi:ribose transport system substrate-binding protein